MAVPRPVLLALLGLALLAAAFLSTRGARDPGGAVTAAPAPAPVAPSTEAAKPAQQPEPAEKPAPADEAKPAAPVDRHACSRGTSTAAPPARPSRPPCDDPGTALRSARRRSRRRHQRRVQDLDVERRAHRHHAAASPWRR